MIHVENLSKYYNGFCAVDQINLDIKKGEIVGLLGPNGAGKTTTLRMLTGYFSPSSGDIRVKDLSVHDNPLAVKSLIGYLPESAPLYKSMLVYDYLDHIARIRGLKGSAKEQRLQELSDICGLRDIMHKTIDALSKGLTQRVGLAHAMMGDPEILILDEPTSGLDPNQIIDIRQIIRNIGEEKTVILSTHILSEAEATCDRVVIINRGKIIADGSVVDIKAKNSGVGRVQITLLGADLEAVRDRLGAVSGVIKIESAPTEDPAALKVNIYCEDQSDPRADLYAVIKSTDWVLLGFQQTTKHLETIFRELTREN